LEILSSLADEPKRFTALQRSVNVVHATSFQKAVQRLIDHGLVCHPSDGDGLHYTLTPRGERALPALVAFVRDLEQWDDARGGNDRSGKR
jgi:DNA-binding HxlR family transcriptional regulator